MKQLYLFLMVPLFCTALLHAQSGTGASRDGDTTAESKFFAGLGIGSVAGINLALEQQLQEFSVGLSGAYWSKNYYGADIMLEKPFFAYTNFRGNIALLGGIHSAPVPAGDGSDGITGSKTQPFLGAAVQFHLSHFYVLTGIECGFNDRPANVQPLWQFGYLLRLNK
jgi:hypothetical protein